MEDGFSILSLDSNRNMTLVKGFFHQWLPTPDNFRCSFFECALDTYRTINVGNVEIWKCGNVGNWKVYLVTRKKKYFEAFI